MICKLWQLGFLPSIRHQDATKQPQIFIYYIFSASSKKVKSTILTSQQPSEVRQRKVAHLRALSQLHSSIVQQWFESMLPIGSTKWCRVVTSVGLYARLTYSNLNRYYKNAQMYKLHK